MLFIQSSICDYLMSQFVVVGKPFHISDDEKDLEFEMKQCDE